MLQLAPVGFGAPTPSFAEKEKEMLELSVPKGPVIAAQHRLLLPMRQTKPMRMSAQVNFLSNVSGKSVELVVDAFNEELGIKTHFTCEKRLG